jgi:YVTN family beta-propeller protein
VSFWISNAYIQLQLFLFFGLAKIAPHILDITNDGKLLFVANAASNNVFVINTITLNVIKKIP